MQYLNNLNPQQKEAVVHKDGPLLIIAGAGAGKTRVITYRILHLIQSGIEPESILAVTFTNKAAKEMRERVHNLLQKENSMDRLIFLNNSPFVSTFHSLGVNILRENYRLIDVSKNFTIFDRTDSLKLIKQAIKNSGYDSSQFEPRKILSSISKQKGDGLNVFKYEEQNIGEYYPKVVSDIWKKYETYLKNEKAFDFDDLLLKTVELLKNNPELQKKYHDRWNYIHIDEYQDTNLIQNELAKLLTNKNNICVVGDVDQTIYTWRGADISNILRFEKEYPNTKTVLLEENYRSTKTIIAASNHVIEKNNNRPEKNLFTKNIDGEKISVFNAYSEVDEAYFVAEKASKLISDGIKPKEISVLYRANFQSRILEQVFLEQGIPYQVLGVRFFDRKEVKDILSFLRYALNEDSISDLKRIINVPPRGIGKVTLTRIVTGKENEFTPAMKNKVDDFRKLLSNIKNSIQNNKPSETIKYVLKATGIEKHLTNKNEDDLERLENIKELVTLTKKYDVLNPEEGIQQLLTDAALATDQDEMTEEKNSVKLMTVHASKGLEFDYVFITGLEDGLFPHESLGDSRVDDEEERRLFYVAITRARKKVFLTYSTVRTIFGSQQVNTPSEFIEDIDDNLLESENEEFKNSDDKIEYLDLDKL